MLVQSGVHQDEGWECQCCSRSLLLSFWLFPTATPHRSQHPSVTATLDTGEQEKELGLVNAVLQTGSMLGICELLLQCRRGKKSP